MLPPTSTPGRRSSACAPCRSWTSPADGLALHESLQQAIAAQLRAADPALAPDAPASSHWTHLRAELRQARPGRAVALHGRHALPDRQPGGARGVLPQRRPAARRRARRGPDTAAVVGDRPRATTARHAAALIERWQERGAGDVLGRPRPGRDRVAGFFMLVDGGLLHPSLVRRRPGPRGVDAPPPRPSAADRASSRSGYGAGSTASAARRPCAVTGGVLARRQAHLHGAAPRAAPDVRRRPRRAGLLAGRRAARVPPVRELGRRRSTGVEYTQRRARLRPRLRRRLARRASSPTSSGSSGDRRARRRRASSSPSRASQVRLTPLEFGLFRHLARARGPQRDPRRAAPARSGAPTSPAGATSSTPSCVRCGHKLGAEATVVETVRGSGYRLRADWRAHLN